MRAGAKVVQLPSGAKTGRTDLAHGPEERPLRPSQCRAYMRRTLAKEFRGIVQGFVEEAKSGSCQHVKLATELLEAKAKARTTPSGGRTLRRLVHKMQQLED